MKSECKFFEEVEAIVELVDAELIEDKQYASIGKNPADRKKPCWESLIR